MSNPTATWSRRKPVLISEDIHNDVKIKAARIGLAMHEAGDNMAKLWLALSDKKAKNQ